MQRKYIFSFILLLILTGCASKEYKISGTVDNQELFNSQKVYLSERINREMIPIDSTEVIDGKFEFTGEADSTKVVYLQFTTKEGDVKWGNFILENGKMTAHLDADNSFSLTGTPQNEILSEFYSEERELDRDIKDLQEVKESKEHEGSDFNAKEAAAKAEMHKKELAYNKVMENINTLVGTHIFLSRFWQFNIEQKEQIFAEMSEETKAIERVNRLIEATEIEKKTSVGETYVDFTLATPEGEDIALSDLVGKTDYLLIDFWASWCGPCIRAIPELKELHDNNRTKLTILGVSLDRSKDEWVDAINKYKLDWLHVSDLVYWESEAAKMYAVNLIPSTVLINKEGVIVGRNLKMQEINNMLNP